LAFKAEILAKSGIVFKTDQISPKSRLSNFLIIILLTVVAFGTVEKISLAEKIKRASLIVIGTVKLTQSHWEETDRGKRIFTSVQIDVEKYVKGAGKRLIEIKVPGGKVGKITEEVPDVPNFSTGEKVVLFLKPNFFRIVGWNQGKYTIEDDKVVGIGIKVDEFINKIQIMLNKESCFDTFMNLDFITRWK
jgi:hypothetical protein